MKLLVLFLSVFSLTFSSCEKNDKVEAIAPALVGNWRMIGVKDNATSSTLSKPASINGEVEITFTFSSYIGGTIDGNTPTNTLTANFTIRRNRSIQIPAVSATKVMETSWGKEFLDNITFSQDYIFETDGKLDIHTADKTLIFQKL
jgi:hypothetical protein